MLSIAFGLAGLRLIFAAETCDPSQSQDGTCKANLVTTESLSQLQILLGGGLMSGGHVWPGSPTNSSCIAASAVQANAAGEICMLLLTHQHVLRYCPEMDTIVVLQELFAARFRGAIESGSAKTIWILASPIGPSAQDAVAGDELWEISLAKPGKRLRRLGVPGTRDAHEMLRVGDTVWVVDTGNGALAEFGVPDKTIRDRTMLKVQRRHELWQPRDHINQIALAQVSDPIVAENGSPKPYMFVNRHKKNMDGSLTNSDFHVVNLQQSKIEMTVSDFGSGSHGLSAWRDCGGDGSTYIVNLDSNNGGFALKDIASGRYVTVWQAQGDKFTKGLTVIGDKAYFGLSMKHPGVQARLTAEVTLVAIDLPSAAKLFRETEGAVPPPKQMQKSVLVWKRILPFGGLLNNIVGPSSVLLPQLGKDGAALQQTREALVDSRPAQPMDADYFSKGKGKDKGMRKGKGRA